MTASSPALTIGHGDHCLPCVDAPTCDDRLGIAFHLDQELRQLRVPRVRPHGSAADLDRDCLSWAADFGLVSDDRSRRRLARIGCGACAAYTWPYATLELLTFGARFIAWMFMFDDAVGEGAGARDLREHMETLASYDRVLFGAACPPDATPLHTALADLMSSAAALADTLQLDWVPRFRAGVRRFFDGCTLEFSHRRARRSPGLAEYRRIRALSIGAHSVFAISELATGHLLSEEAFQHPLAIRATEQASLMLAWGNDIYSFPKECSDREPLNLVSVIAREDRLDGLSALRAAVDTYNKDLSRFESTAATASRLSPALAAYTHGLACWIHGNTAWSAVSRRYAAPCEIPTIC